MSPRESPLEAYRVDLERNPGREDFGTWDTLWLLVSHCLGRVARADLDLRVELGQACAKALTEFCAADDALTAHPLPEASPVREIISGLDDLCSPGCADRVATGARALAERMADAGATASAAILLSFARHVAIGAGQGERGLLAVAHARACRQLGDLEQAEDLYEVAETIAERSRDVSLHARVAVGRGTIARVRGNYPAARAEFAKALELAQASHCADVEMMAHQGLTITAGVAGDFDRALSHGWRCYELACGDVAREAEALTNLAQICLEVGQPRAALQGFLSALGRTSALRVRLPQLGGAAEAAARSGNVAVLQAIADAASREMERSELHYENAQASFSLAVAFARVGNRDVSERFRQQARRAAKAGGFFELMHSLQPEPFAARVNSGRAARTLDPESADVVRAVAGFEADPRALALA